MKRVTKMAVACVVLIAAAGQVQAGIISISEYSLTEITGVYAWGQTDWNDVVSSGSVNNVTDLGAVESLMSDGYTFSPSGGTINGIYNWPIGGFHALTFGFNGGTDFILDSLSFISSRNYGDTPITVDYMLDGGGWITAASTTSDTLGITTGSANTYMISLGGIQADAFRFTTNSGRQVSLHEISVEGAAATVPEPSSLALFGICVCVAGVGAARRRRREKAARGHGLI